VACGGPCGHHRRVRAGIAGPGSRWSLRLRGDSPPDPLAPRRNPGRTVCPPPGDLAGDLAGGDALQVNAGAPPVADPRPDAPSPRAIPKARMGKEPSQFVTRIVQVPTGQREGEPRPLLRTRRVLPCHRVPPCAQDGLALRASFRCALPFT
jgi:hypothetical protein